MIKPYYQDEWATIYHGDCREVIPQLEPVDLVLTDPPYGMAYSSNHGASWEGTQINGDSDTGLRDFVLSFYAEMPIACFGTWKVQRPESIRAVLIWDKGPAFGMGDLQFPWKPSFEEVYILGKGWSGKRDEGVLKGHIQVSWESKGRCHPNQKPISLMKYLISRQPKAKTVLDPFMGSGTTLRAAKDLAIKSIGIEIEEKYCKLAIERLRQESLLGSMAINS